MKKRILPVIIAILLILVIAGGALGKVLAVQSMTRKLPARSGLDNRVFKKVLAIQKNDKKLHARKVLDSGGLCRVGIG